jgi:hypothetical protein
MTAPGHVTTPSRWTAIALEIAVLAPWAALAGVWIAVTLGGLVTGDGLRLQSLASRWLTLFLLIAVMAAAVEILGALVLWFRRRGRD